MKIIIHILLGYIYLFAVIDDDAQNRIKQLYFGEDSRVLDRSGKKLIQSRSVDNDSFLYEVLYEKIKARGGEESPINIAISSPTELHDNVKYHNKVIKEIKKANKKEQLKQKKPEKIHLRGYCRFKNDVEVDLIKTYAKVNCEFRHPRINRAKLMLSLIPNPKLKVLIATPIYVDTEHEPLDVIGGVVMSADQTSINIANYVNDILLKEVAAKSFIRGGDIAYAQAIGFLEEKKASRTTESVQTQIVDNGNGGTTTVPIKTTNQLPPSPNDYITAGLVTFASSLVKIFGEAYLSRLHYVFKVYRNNQVYVDLVVTKKDINYNKAESIKYDTGAQGVSSEVISIQKN